ncbi:MAG TPA: SusC/RagA family TonB-linked outer membrane protein [Gemmatimonadaceae bacterium]
MKYTRSRRRAAVLGAVLALAASVPVLVPRASQAQAVTGRITGRVVDAATNAPVAQAQVIVVGSTLGSRTDAGGEYTIVGVPAGMQQLRVLRLGYAAVTQSVTVVADQTTQANFALQEQALTLDVVVTTATGETQRTRETGNSVGVITSEDITPAATPNLSNVLAGRTAGVSVLHSGGTTGTGAKVRIRGANSLSLSNEPLLIVDGVRVNNSPESNSIGVGGQSPSRINDINPEDIATIEILKGPAASALYGTAAANGVIQITTKKGVSGRPVVQTYYEMGSIREYRDYPANYQGFDAAGDACYTVDEADGFCTIADVQSFNPIETHSPFRTGGRQKVGLSVSGGSDATTFYVSGDYEDEDGIYKSSNLDRANLRGNLNGSLYDRVNFSVNTGYLSSDLRLPQNDNNILGILSGGLLGSYEDGSTCGYIFACPETLDYIETMQEVDRFIGGVSGNAEIVSWLRVTGNAGLDLLNRYDHELIPPGRVFFSTLGEGERTSNRFQIGNYTANISGTATFELTPTIISQTSAGTQFQREIFRGTSAYGAVLTPGTGNLEGTAARFAVGESYVDNRTFGAFVQEQLSLNDRLYLTLAVRGDDNSAFGRDFGFAYYPSVSASWVVSEEPFFPLLAAVSSLRLRTAYGQSGLRPSFRDAVTYFNSVAVRTQDGDVPGITVGGLGNAQLEPERTSEYEAGVDVGFLDGMLGLELTYYNKESTDALVSRRTAPSGGTPTSVFVNLGSVTNRGIEALLNTRVARSENFSADVTLTYSYNKNELVDLGTDAAGNPLPPIIFGLGGDTQRHEEGHPLGAYFQRPILGWADENGDGLIGSDEVEVGDEPAYLGSSLPTRQASLTGSMTLFEWVQLSALFDYKGGFKQFNSTEEFRCDAFFNCRAINDPTAPLDEQARAVAGAIYATAAGYIEDADFVKLREIALTFSLPDRVASQFRVAGLSLTLAGNNLATWTDYTGLDPEINFGGAQNFSQAEFLSQPPVKTYTGRINVTF